MRQIKLMKTKLLTICLLLIVNQAFAEVKEVNNEKIISLIQGGGRIIDIRRACEWQDTGVIKQSNLITFFFFFGNYNRKD